MLIIQCLVHLRMCQSWHISLQPNHWLHRNWYMHVWRWPGFEKEIRYVNGGLVISIFCHCFANDLFNGRPHRVVKHNKCILNFFKYWIELYHPPAAAAKGHNTASPPALLHAVSCHGWSSFAGPSLSQINQTKWTHFHLLEALKRPANRHNRWSSTGVCTSFVKQKKI